MINSLYSDVKNRINYEKLKNEHEIKICLKDYNENLCEKETRIPALEEFCIEKQRCFERNHLIEIGLTKASVHIFAEILNEFFNTITLKALFGSIILYLRYKIFFK